MKKFICLLVLFSFFSTIRTFARDSVLVYIDSLLKRDTLTTLINDTTVLYSLGSKSVRIQLIDKQNCNSLDGFKKFIILIPFICLFVLIFIFCFFSFTLGTQSMKNIAKQIFLTIDSKEVEKFSIGRFIAFLSGSISIIVIIVILTVYLYNILAECKINIDFSALNTILITLGIGVALPLKWLGNSQD